jgi:hypothetical protein
VSHDGENVYLLSANESGTSEDLSVWRLAGGWERILSVTDMDADFIIRMAPDDSDVLYVADEGGTTIYYTSDGGEGKWHTRVSRYTIADLAVETNGDVAYVLEGPVAAHISKSTNSGFTWATKVSHKISDGANMILSLGEDELLAAGDGKVSYSKDGNTTWTKINDGIADGSTVHATATGLDDGDFVLCSGDDSGGNMNVWHWEIGEDDEFDQATADGDIPSGMAVTGLTLFEGGLYVVAANATDSISLRTLSPTDEDPTWSTATELTDVYDLTPTALRTSVDENVVKLWAIDRILPALASYKDTLALAVMEISGPRDGLTVPFNRVSGESEQVIFSWESPSDEVTEFDFEIATDSGFDEDVLSLAIVKATGSWDEGDIISQIVGPGASGSANIKFMENTTYYWRIRVDSGGPIQSAWSETRSFTTGSLPEAVEPVIIEQPPAPVIEVPQAPAITIEPPEVVIPPSPPITLPQPQITLPPAPAPVSPIPDWALYVIIIIGAVLVIALVILILRTRRPV